MKYDRKYLFGFVVFLTTVAALAVGSFLALTKSNNEQSRLIENEVRQLVLAEKVGSIFDLQLSLLPSFILSGSTAELRRIHETHEKFSEVIQQLEVISKNADSRELILDIKNSENDVFSLVEPILETRRKGTSRKFQEATFRNVIIGRPLEIDKKLDQLTELKEKALAHAEAQAKSSALWHIRLATLLLVLALIFLCLIAGLLTFVARSKRRESLLQFKILEKERRLSIARKEIVEVVAHDLKNPLASMEMSLQILREDPDFSKSSESKMGLEIADRSVKNMNQLIFQLLDNTKIESGNLVLEKAPCLVQKLSHLYVEPLRLIAQGKLLELAIDFPVEPMMLDCDETRLGQVLSNLIGNAIKYTAAGGKIKVSCTMSKEGAHFVVQNSGSVIPAEVLPHIFDRYWQPRSSQKQGAGLGLAISKGLVEAHGGSIQVESSNTIGTRFSFYVPQQSLNASKGTLDSSPEISSFHL